MRTIATCTMLLLGSLAFAQVPSHDQGSPQSKMSTSVGPEHGENSVRARLATECGVKDVAPEKAMVLSRSLQGQWHVVRSDADDNPTDNGRARVWHEPAGAWFLVVQESGKLGTDDMWMHSGDFCFDATQRLQSMRDVYMDTAANVQRATEWSKGKTQTRVADLKGRAVAQAASAKMPAPYGFKRLEQLPFYGFLQQDKEQKKK